ncbi:MAG TPA: glycosyltransferase family 4 protein [Candidatus Paceibacterota bacterium]|nr:glycosyltransferase family 4 protein [Candidatus Paceibacterota bacterium]
MRICYLSTARIPDDWGHVVQIMKMCEAFAKAGNDVELVVPRRAGRRNENPYAYVGADNVFRITKLPCIDISATGEGKFLYWLRTFSFLLVARLYTLIKKYDVLYTREPAASLFFKDFVFEAHSVSKSVESISKKACKVVAITSFIKDELVTAGVRAQNVLVAADAVDLNAFKNAESKEKARTRLGLPQDKKIALYLGRLDSWKGTDVLYGAADLLPEDIQMVIIGVEPAQLDTLRAQHPRIIFFALRPYKEVADNQAAADVLILPNTGKNVMSSRYTSPLKLFSYMASGIPIVASDISSIREILNESNAMFVTPDDSMALAQGIKKTLTDLSVSEKRAEKARDDVELHTWDARASAILSFLSI